MGRVVHFELHAADPDRARLFYEEVFGWEIARVGVMPYWLVRTGLEEKRLLAFANMADCMRVRGISREYAELLRAAGVDTVKDLKYRNPQNLAQAMAEANKKRKKVRLLPSEKLVVRWIEHARKLPPKITY